MPPRGVGPLVFVVDVEHPELEDADRHHLQKVLRLRAGDAFVVADGVGSWRPVRFGDPVEVDGAVVVDGRPDPPLTVGLAPTKGDRPEWAVQKLTELSIDHIVILRTERSVIRWDGDRLDHHLERLRRIAREAAMQSRRSWLPTVDGVHGLADHPDAVLADPGGRPLTLGDGVVLCGPEGGWSDDERAEARDRVGLGPAVLRAETAAVTAGALLAALRHGLVRPA
ncbi:MAG TPA: RsmE family RNA methyltransferase [Acidimicrobiales bacterium]